MLKCVRQAACRAVVVIVASQAIGQASATDLIVSANDGKFVRVAGEGTYPDDAGADTLTVIDATRFPPVVTATVEVEHTLAGPPQGVAITPDGRLAIVSAPNRFDRETQQVLLGQYLQIVDLSGPSPRVIDKVDIGAHPQGLAVHPDGTLLLAATLSGTVAVLDIDGSQVSLQDQLDIADSRLSGVTFTHNGDAAMVALRDAQGIVVLDVVDGKVSTARDRVTTGIGPYAVDVSADGQWAVVGNAGLASLPDPGRLHGDADTVTLIDVSRRPFRAVQHITVPSVPEGVAISPNGRWIAVQTMDGSNLPPDNPARKSRGTLVLFEIRDGAAIRAADLPGGEAGQGIVFSADSKFVFVQLFVEKQIAIYAVNDGELSDTGRRITVSGGPASIRSMPR